MTRNRKNHKLEVHMVYLYDIISYLYDTRTTYDVLICTTLNHICTTLRKVSHHHCPPTH